MSTESNPSPDSSPRFHGTPSTLGGRTFTIPPLSIRELRPLLPRIEKLKAITSIPTAEDLDTVIDIVASAVQRNYPDVTRDEILELLDMSNAADLVRIALGRNLS